MTTTLSDFDDETIWERTVLSFALPLMPLTSSEVDFDHDTGAVYLRLRDGISAAGVEQLRNRLLPLLLGSAWKILDLGLELAFALAGLVPENGKRWLLKEKEKNALSGGGALPGFTSSSDLWRALTSLYARTIEIRHALVHRRVRVDATTNELVGVNDQGISLPPVTFDEQIAFCRFAQRFAHAILMNSIDRRTEADLRGQLIQLQSHHGIQVTGTVPGRPPVRVRVKIGGPGYQVDVMSLMEKTSRTFPGVQYVDVELHLDDNRVLVGELESAPQTVVSIDPAALPPWLRFA